MFEACKTLVVFQLLGQWIFQESLTWDERKTEVGERGLLQLVKLEKYSIQVSSNIESDFQLKFTLTYLNVKRPNATRPLLLHCQSDSMTSRCSSPSCWLSMLRQGPVKKKRYQTISNPRTYNAICAKYTATGGCNHEKPTKIHEPEHTSPTNPSAFGTFREVLWPQPSQIGSLPHG